MLHTLSEAVLAQTLVGAFFYEAVAFKYYGGKETALCLSVKRQGCR